MPPRRSWLRPCSYQLGLRTRSRPSPGPQGSRGKLDPSLSRLQLRCPFRHPPRVPLDLEVPDPTVPREEVSASALRGPRRGPCDWLKVGWSPVVPRNSGDSGVSAGVPAFLNDLVPPPSDGFPVGGRLSLFWRTWQRLGASSWVVTVLRKGFKFKFLSYPVLSPVPLPFPPPCNMLR